MITYRITALGTVLDSSQCPPVILKIIFPAFKNEQVTVTETDIRVTFAEPQTPTDLGPLIKIEVVS